MDKLKITQLLANCSDALATLEWALTWGLKNDEEIEQIEDLQEKAQAELSRDGLILRFEYTYELAWKLMKEVNSFLGVDCASPKECMRYALINGLIIDATRWFDYADSRNLIVHTYNRLNAKKITEKIEDFVVDMRKLIDDSKGVVDKIL